MLRDDPARVPVSNEVLAKHGTHEQQTDEKQDQR